MRLLMIFAAGVLLAATPDPRDIQLDKWRANYEASLKAPDGWLSVAGLSWLHDGANTVALPNHQTALLDLKNGKVTYEKRVLKSDITAHPDVLKFGNVTLTVIERGGKTGVRLRDPDAETRRDFTGCKWFPASAAWRIDAKWVAYPKAKTIAITNILGMTDQEPSPGYAEFTLQGKQVRLEPVVEDGELFFMFKDATSAKSTYGAGRFVYADMPKGDKVGKVEIDFNKAHNPPCAFTAFATCPLPPRQNILPIAIEAGEKSYAKH
jgi:uncharacterized protein (DUF1684 family)